MVVDYMYFYVDNEGYDVFEVIVFMEEGIIDYEFDEVEFIGYLCFIVYYLNEIDVIVIVYRFIGDKIGLFYLRVN